MMVIFCALLSISFYSFKISFASGLDLRLINKQVIPKKCDLGTVEVSIYFFVEYLIDKLVKLFSNVALSVNCEFLNQFDTIIFFVADIASQ